jgi:acetyl-CoA C-acetyltransferase
MAYEDSAAKALVTRYDDVYLVAGARTPFADYNGVLRDVNPIDMGIFAARALFERSGIPASEVQSVVAGNMAQAGFDAYYLPRHIGLYSGVPATAPAMLATRICGTGFETIAGGQPDRPGQRPGGAGGGRRIHVAQPGGGLHAPRGLSHGADRVSRLLVGSLHRPGHPPGHGQHRRKRCIEVRHHPRRRGCLRRPELCPRQRRVGWRLLRRRSGGGEQRRVCPRGLPEPLSPAWPTGSSLSGATSTSSRPASKPCKSSSPPSRACRPAATARPSSMAALRCWWHPANTCAPTASSRWPASLAASLGRRAARDHGHGPGAGDPRVLAKAGLSVADVGRVEINEAFGAQYLGCERELGLDREPRQHPRRRHRHRPPAGCLRHAPDPHRVAPALAGRPAVRHRVGLRRRRPGHGDARRARLRHRRGEFIGDVTVTRGAWVGRVSAA